MPVLIIIIAVVVVVGLWFVGVYNALITLKNRALEGWSDIDVQLKRRFNLIPNLVDTVKGYASHESDVFRKVTEARASAMKSETPAEHAQTENMLSAALKSLFAVAEAYPELKASNNFSQLQADLTDTEDKIQAARRFYNGTVRDFNTKIQVFPNSIIAGVFSSKFKNFEFFEIAEEAERSVPKVSF